MFVPTNRHILYRTWKCNKAVCSISQFTTILVSSCILSVLTCPVTLEFSIVIPEDFQFHIYLYTESCLLFNTSFTINILHVVIQNTHWICRHGSIQESVHLFINVFFCYFFCILIHSFVHSSMSAFVHLFTHSSIHPSFLSSINLFLYAVSTFSNL